VPGEGSLNQFPRRIVTVAMSESYVYDPERVQALYEQLQPDPDLYGDEPVYAVFAYLGESAFRGDVFEAQGAWGEWIEKDEEYDPDA